MLEQRLDKWLWCARLTKTRTGAARLISDGKVRITAFDHQRTRFGAARRHVAPGR